MTVRIIFSPHTADPRYLAEVATAVADAQFTVARAMWGAQLQVWQTMLAAQFTVLGTICRASSRRAEWPAGR